ncbi:MAG: alpha-amylase family glycosyl hydrolase, partial [Microbacterium sp.]
TDSLRAFPDVGAPATWVLSNHDVIRHATRLALPADVPQGHGIGPKTPDLPDTAVGLHRGRAATTLMLALPGSAYLYQGEELGLPEAVDLPDDARQDPTWFRHDGERYGRDGCRVPIPWEAGLPAYGFNQTGETWLPQPDDWAEYARDRQAGLEGSTLELYRTLLRLRRELGLASGELQWAEAAPDDVLTFGVGEVTVIANLGEKAVPLPQGADVLVSSGPLKVGAVPADTAVWLRGA